MIPLYSPRPVNVYDISVALRIWPEMDLAQFLPKPRLGNCLDHWQSDNFTYSYLTRRICDHFYHLNADFSNNQLEVSYNFYA